MREQTIGDWLDALGSARPAPGGGAAAALLVATAASLVEMVANLTIGKPRYAEHEPTMIVARDTAIQIRTSALRTAADDERAFDSVAAAYKISKDDPDRSAAIQRTTAAAARPPLQTAELAAQVIALAEGIHDGANVNVLSDIAVAASSARAALESAAINVEVNLAALHDREHAAALANELATHLSAADTATATIRRVREGFRHKAGRR
jgi:formiminotetrahydrofolate cyclodeaminase